MSNAVEPLATEIDAALRVRAPSVPEIRNGVEIAEVIIVDIDLSANSLHWSLRQYVRLPDC
jgi:hypothetical protein